MKGKRKITHRLEVRGTVGRKYELGLEEGRGRRVMEGILLFLEEEERVEVLEGKEEEETYRVGTRGRVWEEDTRVGEEGRRVIEKTFYCGGRVTH